MHYLPDTNDEDAVRERYWPGGYKLVISKEVSRIIGSQLNEKSLVRAYRAHYSEKYSEAREFLGYVTGGVVIGAENGADMGFEIVYSAFLSEIPLPKAYQCANVFWPGLGEVASHRVKGAIIKDFREDDGFTYAYRDGYTRDYATIDGFLKHVAAIIVAEVENSVSATLARYYAAFFHGWPLPLMRRNPRRLKTW
jgi:hypothetical protein